ncbi:MAG: galactokinase [Bacteroidales bacterium]|nr:galactokinase [Bacteroidales bacterium]
MNCEIKFEQIWRKSPEAVDFCPYRVCPIGAHSDHQKGRITGLAIDKGIHIAWSVKRNGVVEVVSLQFEKRAQWHVRGVSETRDGDWADYLRGATLELGRRYPLTCGISGVIEGSLPIGGLSSSAAVTIAFLSALCRANGIRPSENEIIEVAVASENHYVGVSSGKLDQSCELFCRKDHLLYLDTQDDHYELIPAAGHCKPWRIAIFFSGVERTLAGSKFNMRVDEARSAAYALKAFSGMGYGKFAQTCLRDVPRDIYEAYKDRLPEPWRRRAEHFYTEYGRVMEGAAAWRAGDIETFGRLITESGHSSIYNWETGSAELKTLYEIMCRTDGIYGGRFSGAGFKGCCMALIDPAYEDSIRRSVREAYISAFPALESNYSDYVCDSADGAIF